MFRWKPEVEPSHVETVSAALDELAKLSVIRSFRHGPDAGLSDGNYDYAVIAEFDSPADWQVYRDDPGHRELIAQLLAPYIADRAAVQFELPD